MSLFKTHDGADVFPRHGMIDAEERALEKRLQATSLAPRITPADIDAVIAAGHLAGAADLDIEPKD